MTKTRLEAFSDGVIAIIITIMVLEIKVPQSKEWEVIKEIFPVMESYILSFVFLGIYWANHHHLIHTIKTVGSGILWANLHLLFWLSLIPFGTAWMGKTDFDKTSVIFYAILVDLCGIAYYLLLVAIKNKEKDNEKLQQLLKKQSSKGIISNIAYTAAIPIAFLSPFVSCMIFVGVALMWIVPDRNIEHAAHNHPEE